jgi:methylase of polypeptide subunit release factors
MEIVNSQIESLGRFKAVTEKKASGATYTPRELATFVAKQILANASLSRDKTLRIFDPAVGEGELLLALIDELKQSGHLKIHAHGFDTNELATAKAISRIKLAHPDVKTDIQTKDFLSLLSSTERSLTLFDNTDRDDSLLKYDLVIANPPYVRTQTLGADSVNGLSEKFGLDGRVDLYYAFLLGISEILGDHSTVGIIVSNRFMTTKAGASVRRELWKRFSINGIWDFGDTKLFDAAVLPAVMTFKKKTESDVATDVPFTSVYSTQPRIDHENKDSIFSAIHRPGTISTPTGSFDIRIGKLDFSGDSANVWRLEDEESFIWLNTVKAHTFCTFRDIGKIRVGIKTTADNVFLGNDWSDRPKGKELELIQPLTTHHIARRFRAAPDKGYRVLYPHKIENGKRTAIALDEYPYSKAYLEQFRKQLEGRKYVIEAGRKWYEIWVPQDPAAWSRPKIVFRDIAERPTFWMDLTGSIVNGDCYWMMDDQSTSEERLWLVLAVANSTFIESFYDHRFNNKLYAGRRRFMTQYVEQFPLPRPDTKLAEDIISKVKFVYNSLANNMPTPEVEDEIDSLVWQAFGLVRKNF